MLRCAFVTEYFLLLTSSMELIWTLLVNIVFELHIFLGLSGGWKSLSWTGQANASHPTQAQACGYGMNEVTSSHLRENGIPVELRTSILKQDLAVQHGQLSGRSFEQPRDVIHLKVLRKSQHSSAEKTPGPRSAGGNSRALAQLLSINL
jgi:hypothetical protein